MLFVRIWKLGSLHKALVIMMLSIASVQASTLLVGTPLSGSVGEAEIGSCCFLEQAFTLTSAVQVTDISLQMSGFGTDTYTLWLTNAIGSGATAANVLFQMDLTFPNTGGASPGATVSIATNLFLDSGSYFLVESSEQTSVAQGWVETGLPALSTSFGSVGLARDTVCCLGVPVNHAFPPGSTFDLIDSTSPEFQISGNVVPEPRLIFFWLTGLATIVFLKARTRDHV